MAWYGITWYRVSFGTLDEQLFDDHNENESITGVLLLDIRDKLKVCNVIIGG